MEYRIYQPITTRGWRWPWKEGNEWTSAAFACSAMTLPFLHQNLILLQGITIYLLLPLCGLSRTVQFSHSVMSDSETLWTAACQASLSIINSQGLLKLMSIELVMPSNHLILCHPLLLRPSVFPSIKIFSNESALRCTGPSLQLTGFL